MSRATGRVSGFGFRVLGSIKAMSRATVGRMVAASLMMGDDAGMADDG